MKMGACERCDVALPHSPLSYTLSVTIILIMTLGRHHHRYYSQASVEDWERAMHSGVQAVDHMGSVLSVTSQADPDFSGFVLEYIDSAAKISEVFAKLGGNGSALEWAETALANAEVLFKTYAGEERVMASELARLHLLLGEMAMRNAQVSRARDQLQLSRTAKLAFDPADNLSRDLRRKEKWLELELVKYDRKK